VTYTAADARQQLLDTVATATEELGLALAALGEAYEHLDEHSAERLEEDLFRPLQAAYGRAQRTHREFGVRHELPTRTFQPASRRAPSTGVKGLLDEAVAAAGKADTALAALQDSMLPIEVGDAELRAGLQEVRALLSDLSRRSRELVRTFGR
jgi:hypothetical protein